MEGGGGSDRRPVRSVEEATDGAAFSDFRPLFIFYFFIFIY